MLKNLLLIFCFSLLCTLGSLAQQKFTSFDDTMIHYDIVGQGRPVLLLHGYIVDGRMWRGRALATTLAKAGFQVIIPDLRGNGLSDRPQQLEKYQNDAELRDMIALMAHLGHTQYDVVGYSRGAILTARLLVLDKKHIRTATLGGMGEGFMQANWHRKAMFYETFDGKAHLHPETASAVQYAKSIGADTLVLRHLQAVQPSVSTKQLGKLKNPVMVICGDEDRDNGDPAELAKAFKNVSLKTVKGNHNNSSSTQLFADEVLSFLQKN
jgi:pimeloyl-ACP methyl ester carboxylesterase